MGCGFCKSQQGQVDQAQLKQLCSQSNGQIQQLHKALSPSSKDSQRSDQNSSCNLKRNKKDFKISQPNRTFTVQQEKDKRHSLSREEEQKTKTLIFTPNQQPQEIKSPIFQSGPIVGNNSNSSNLMRQELRQNSNRSSGISEAFTFDPYKGELKLTGPNMQKKSNFCDYNSQQKPSLEQIVSDQNSPQNIRMGPIHRSSNPSIQYKHQQQTQQSQFYTRSSVTDLLNQNQQFGSSANFGYRHSIQSMEGLDMQQHQYMQQMALGLGNQIGVGGQQEQMVSSRTDSLQQDQQQNTSLSDIPMKRVMDKKLSVVQENNEMADINSNNDGRSPGVNSNRGKLSTINTVSNSKSVVNYQQYFKTNLLDLLKSGKQQQNPAQLTQQQILPQLQPLAQATSQCQQQQINYRRKSAQSLHLEMINNQETQGSKQLQVHEQELPPLTTTSSTVTPQLKHQTSLSVIQGFRKQSRRVSNFLNYCDMQDVNIAKQNPKINLVDYVKFKKQQKFQQEIYQDEATNNGVQDSLFLFDGPSPINRGIKKYTFTSVPRRSSKLSQSEDFNVFQQNPSNYNFTAMDAMNGGGGGVMIGNGVALIEKGGYINGGIAGGGMMGVSTANASGSGYNSGGAAQFLDENQSKSQSMMMESVDMISRNELSKYDFFIEENGEGASMNNNNNNNNNDFFYSNVKPNLRTPQMSQSKHSFSEKASLASLGNQSNIELNQGMRQSVSTFSDNNLKQLCQIPSNSNSVNNINKKQSSSDQHSQSRSNNTTAQQLQQMNQQSTSPHENQHSSYTNNKNSIHSYDSEQTSFQSQLCSPNKQALETMKSGQQPQPQQYHDTTSEEDERKNYLTIKLATATTTTQASTNNKNQAQLFNILEDNNSMEFENSRITNKLSQKQDSNKQINSQQQKKSHEVLKQEEILTNSDDKQQQKSPTPSQKQAKKIETQIQNQTEKPTQQLQVIKKSMTTQFSSNNKSVNFLHLSPEPRDQVRTSQKSLDDRPNYQDDADDPGDGDPNTQMLRRVKSVNYSRLQESHSFIYTDKLDKSTDASGQKKINQYVILNHLGKGSFGKVKLVLDVKVNKYFAAKIINKTKLKKKMLSKTRSAYSLVEQEVAILKKLAHPNICQLFEVIDDPDQEKLLLVMEYVKKGSINSKQYWKQQLDKAYDEDKFENKEYKISVDKIQKYFKDFLIGLDYLHNYANVIHRDIKPDNLLIDSTDCLKIADFGVSKIFDGQNDELSNDTGTKYFLAPEIWSGKPFKGRPADIWATGVTLFMLVTGDPPFQSKSAEQLKKLVLESEPNYPDSMDQNLKHFIQQCLQKNPNLRLNVEQLMIHPWITDNGRCPLEITKYDGSFEVSDKDICKAFTKMTIKTTVFLKKQLKQVLERSRSKIMHKKSMEVN